MAGTVPPELDFERLTFQEKYRRAVSGYMRRLCGIGRFIPKGDPSCEQILCRRRDT